MCGIFVVIPKSKKKLDVDKCKNALKDLDKRGPDWSLYQVIDNIFFGQTVLSMTGKEKKNIDNHYSEKKVFFILFNGEIYNHKELNDDNDFNQDKPDTKILVNLFDKYKPNEINEILDGMYSYVVVDKSKKKIYISRDPQGEKSLYKFESSEFIIFSSEINPILKFTNKLSIDKEIFKSYFLSRHFIQFEKSIFKEIKNIQPGEFWEYSIIKKRLSKKKTFSVKSLIDQKKYNLNETKKEQDLVDELDCLLRENLTQMIPPNRNFCSILSGGIDSSLISILLRELTNCDKFIALNHIGKDRISNKTNLFEKYLNNSVINLNINKEKYKKYLEESIDICNSPISSHDFVGKLIIAEKLKKINCKAVFGGDGADELFGGYDTYLQSIKKTNQNVSDYSKILKTKIFGKNYVNRYFEKKIHEEWKECLKAYDFLENKKEQNKQAMMLMDSTLQLSSVGMRGCDLMSMSYSIEPRSIFLRKSVMKFALNLPLKFKISNLKKNEFKSKILLKKLFIKYYPKKLIFKKQGFSGFPNEMASFLGNYNNFKIFDKFKLYNHKKYLKEFDKKEVWKIINSEFFLKSYDNKVNKLLISK